MAALMKIGSNYDQLVEAIIRPPRARYNETLLGSQKFKLGTREYHRTDLEIRNPRGHTLVCSHFQPAAMARPKAQLPCIVYCHGNCGNRLDVLNDVRVILPHNITVFAFDFSGCGLSGGEYISLGYYEKDDLGAVVNYLRTSGTVSRIGLWGRSMGAATCIMYGATDPSIAGMVLDSSFSSLQVLCLELANSTQVKVPKLMINGVLKIIKKSVQKKANFNLEECEPVKHVGSCFSPALFAHAKGDTFILPHHSKTLSSKYAGDKNEIEFDGDHNTYRPDFFYDSLIIFFHNTLLVDEDADLALMVDQAASGSLNSRLPFSPIINPQESMQSQALGELSGSDSLADFQNFDYGAQSNFNPYSTTTGPRTSFTTGQQQQQGFGYEDEDEDLKHAIALSLLETGSQNDDELSPLLK
eukprot:TRINITY_DN4497_c0_g1_i1.p1 TRINITY_DN4497_c0_g1~~TRINITY_DN4497_c0_g1_i1.p1  ORF type:complete len:440 (+),score=68.52 TRINITY_DN4497_c0_g1_i1:82-1320(+)